MRKGSWIALLAAFASAFAAMATGQQKAEKTLNPAQLEVTTEIAAMSNEGYPAVLRVAVKNAGNVAVDLPLPVLGCQPRGGHLFIHFEWHPADSKSGEGHGWGESCGASDMPSLMDRVRSEWIRLQPGEFVVSSDNLRARLGTLGPGTVEYWFEYVPPEASAQELIELQQAGYTVPTEKIETAHQSFVVH